MKKLLFISLPIVMLILTGCNNVDDILSSYSNIFFKNNEEPEQIKDEEVRNVINYCDIFYRHEEQDSSPEINVRNIYEVFIDERDSIAVEGNYMDISQLIEGAKDFIENNGRDANLSDSPEKAIFLIQSYGDLIQDNIIIERIDSVYNSLNIPSNERKICHMSGSVLEEWMRMHPPPPPPPPPPIEVLEIIEDEWYIEEELEIEDTESDEDEKIEIEEEDDDEFFMVVENMPEFPGGDLGLMKYIQTHVKYPPIAKEYNITGKVYVSFIIERDGRVNHVKVVRGVDKNLDAEAIRVIKSLPKYKPGKQRGKAVRVMFTIPVHFTLN